MSKPENPPAFPGEVRSSTGVAIVGMNEGMSLRDWFAGQALNGLLANDGADYVPLNDGNPARYAADAYKVADAMLTERAKGGDQ